MPLFEYVCRDCGVGFEVLLRRLGDGVTCPACASPRVDRRPSVFAVASAPAPFAPCAGGRCGTTACEGEPCGRGPCGDGARSLSG